MGLDKINNFEFHLTKSDESQQSINIRLESVSRLFNNSF